MFTAGMEQAWMELSMLARGILWSREGEDCWVVPPLEIHEITTLFWAKIQICRFCLLKGIKATYDAFLLWFLAFLVLEKNYCYKGRKKIVWIEER